MSEINRISGPFIQLVTRFLEWKWAVRVFQWGLSAQKQEKESNRDQGLWANLLGWEVSYPKKELNALEITSQKRRIQQEFVFALGKLKLSKGHSQRKGKVFITPWKTKRGWVKPLWELWPAASGVIARFRLSYPLPFNRLLQQRHLCAHEWQHCLDQEETAVPVQSVFNHQHQQTSHWSATEQVSWQQGPFYPNPWRCLPPSPKKSELAPSPE